MISIAAAACPVVRVPEVDVARFRAWLSGGHNAGMEYMENWPDLRADPSLVLPGARTLISLAVPFPLPEGGKPSGPIAAYALGRDYHDVLRNLFRRPLRRLAERGVGEWRLCVDSAPVFERFWAVCSGLGTATDSGMVAVDGFGTACFLFEILTTASLRELQLTAFAPLTPSDFARLFELDAVLPDYASRGLSASECAHCGRCASACPGKALRGGMVDARRCISYLTIEHRGGFDSEVARQVMASPAGRSTLFGCDRCVTVCALNRFPFRDASALFFLPELMPDAKRAALTPEDCLTLSREEFAELFRGSPVKRAKLEGLLRNARGVEPRSDA